MKICAMRTNLAQGQYWQLMQLAAGGAKENGLICLYPEVQYQTIQGFGGAFTESTAVNFQRLSPRDQAEVMFAYFSSDGLGYTVGRTHIGSCDFSLGNYACVEDPADEALDTFSMEHDERYLLPMILRAQETAGRKLRFLLSPWSPPAFMKSNGEMNHGGTLLPKYAERWARCIVEYVRRYRAAGVQVETVTVQNEPEAVQVWDSCLFTAKAEAEFVGRHLGPALQKAGLGDVRVLIWDHNKQRMLLRASETMENEAARAYIGGVAFHWYSGDHFENVAMTAQHFPELDMVFTEGCVEYSHYSQTSETHKAEMYAHDMLGNFNAGMHAFLDWNLLLDADGGPNHVGNFCQAPLMISKEGGVKKQASYYYIGHFSKFIRPGARRIGISRYCQAIEAAAFRNTDGSLAAVLLNGTEESKEFFLQLPTGEAYVVPMQAHEIVSVLLS